ncbi:hypothetical protein ETB97_005176 [Aspergillus alliaceus]|uniref:Uncharacterized protein n=1 Tax=Petromyces alliaceus TaxID=209559 RepID=A0A8H6A0L2_PETAA|nr:hypothetical protein ETB97_005176 [Aspergillus burnettii]
MVSTRQHPRDFPSPPTGKASSSPSPSTRSNGATSRWVHTPSTAITIWLVLSVPHGVSVSGGRGQRKAKKGPMWMLKTDKVVSGRPGAIALLVAYSAFLMTLSKTILYWLNEVFSGFDSIGHNDTTTLILFWIIPNGLWIIFPSYNIYVLGSEMVASLSGSASRRVGRSKSS